ncbi:MAG: FAD-dependent oxidoreductase [Chloroflexota bacterium]|nr:FAD-dependent oxidoreductase [Chloroflexota bacterium]
MDTASPSEKHESFWIDSAPGRRFPSLQGDVLVDVAVLGGGIAGLTAATLLKRAGKRVAVVEAGRLVEGVTGHTTAKVSSGHGLIYAELIKKFGEDGARIYAQSNEAALERIARFVADEGIDCDFERKGNYIYAETEEELQRVQDELEAAQKLGLPVSFVKDTRLPYFTSGAIRYDNQAQFHPRKYLLHLAESLPGDGSFVFEDTRALDVEEGTPHRVMTNKGVVSAQDVIVATHFPFLDRGLLFARVHPYREYVVCARIREDQDPDGMYINTGSPTRSVRTTPYEGGRLLIVVGEKHRTGEETDTEQHYTALEEFARTSFGVEEFEYRWSTQDNYSIDRVPYIGKLNPKSDGVYVATGFSAWGMTNGTLSGMILSDLIFGVQNPWAEFYDPNRAPSLGKLIQENLGIPKHWLGARLAPPEVESLSRLASGEGAIVEVGGEKVAAYRDDQGTVHAISAVCTHMGCIVNWNSGEKSWDCPCHGSRFSADGKVIQGPAVRNLAKKDFAAAENPS